MVVVRPIIVRSSAAGFALLGVVRTLAVITLLSLLSVPVLTNVLVRPTPAVSSTR
jgi:Tfp pilus assembly protein FimT